MNGRIISLGLSLVGVAGVAVTSALSIRCHEKAKNEDDKKKKILCYTPAIISGVGTASCILGSHYISRKEIAALTVGLGYLASKSDKIEAKIREKYGNEALTDIKKEIAQEPKQLPINNEVKAIQPVEYTGHGRMKFVEFYLGREFYSTIEHVEWAEKQLNLKFHNGEYVCMNDFYSLLDLEYSAGGNDFGWAANPDYYNYEDFEEPIIFDNILCEDVDGSPFYMIDIRTSPMMCWMEV